MKILHTADLHLKDKDSLHCLEQVVSKAAEQDCAAILIAGDMFDKNSSYQEIEQEVLRILEIFEGDIFIIPGNHDREFLSKRESLSRNSTVFQDRGMVEAVDYRGVEIWPIPYQEDISLAMINDLAADPGNSILIAHGTYYDNEFFYEDEHKVYFPIFEQDLRDKFSYVALGHYHRAIRHELGRTTVINPGAPRVTRRSDVGPRLVSIIDTEGWHTHMSALDEPFLAPVDLNIQVFDDPVQWPDRLEQLLAGYTGQRSLASVLLKVKGTLPPGFSPQDCRDRLAQILEQQEWQAEAVDIEGLSQLDSRLLENDYVGSLLSELEDQARAQGLDAGELKQFTLSRLNAIIK